MTTLTKTRTSAAMRFVTAAWDGLPSDSWLRLNQHMRQALKLAITGGMKFNKGDIDLICDSYRGRYWFGVSIEDLYALACGSERGTENQSAAIAIEQHLERGPYLWCEDTKTPVRLHEGSVFTWQGMRVKVNSIRADYINVCSYKSGGKRHSEVIDKRIKITLAELTEVRKAADKKRAAYEAELAKAETKEQLKEIKARANNESIYSFRTIDRDLLTQAYDAAKDRLDRL